MRIFYVFDIRVEFRNLYKENTFTLYSILRNIYYLSSANATYGFNLFNQIVKQLDKQKLDNFLFLRLHQDIPYSKKGDKHFYNNLYKDEISILEVKKSFIKITSEQNVTSFLSTLYLYNNNLFVCDFENYDYFFLEKAKKSCLID